MQRILFALVALISFLAINLRSAQSQGAPGQATEPTPTPQRIDQPVQNPEEDPKREGPGEVSAQGSGPHHSEARIEPFVVHANETVPSVTVKNRALILEGHVRGDVQAIDSEVTIRPGATIGGRLILSTPHNTPTIYSHLAEMPTEAAIGEGIHPNRERSNWFNGQFMLWMLGLFSGLILLLIAPRASAQVAETVALTPGRCLAVGGLTAILLYAALAFSGKVMALNNVVSLLWLPVTTLLAIGSLLLLVYGWIAGMRVAGDRIARRFGFPGSGPLYWRISLGLTVFFLANTILGGLLMPIGVLGLLLESMLALMGLGAAVLTGLGNDPDWLARRMRGEKRWLSKN
jgi:hypothetical protein